MIIKFLFLLENTRTCSKDVPGPESRCYKVVANINKHHIRDLFTVHICAWGAKMSGENLKELGQSRPTAGKA